MKNIKSLGVRFSLLVLAALVLAGCQMTKNVTTSLKGDDAVIVTFEEDGVELKVKPSLNQNCINGVNHFRNQDWAQAKAELDLAIQKDPKDHKAQFACGIANEKLGDFRAALEHYKAANFAKTDLQYDSSRLRAEEKVKKLQAD